MRGARQSAACAAAVVAAAAIVAAAAAPAVHDQGMACGSGPARLASAASGGAGRAASPVPCAAAQSAPMSIAVTLADDLLVTGAAGAHLRGDVEVQNYDPREGHLFQEIRTEPGGRVVSKTKIFARTGADGAWVAQVGSLLAPERYPPGDYSIGVVTESGLRSPRAKFVVSGGEGGGGPAAPPPPPGPLAGMPGKAESAPAGAAEIAQDASSRAAEIAQDASSGAAEMLRLDRLTGPPAMPDTRGLEGAVPDAAPKAGPLPEQPAPAQSPVQAQEPPPAAAGPALPPAPAAERPGPARADPAAGVDILGHLAGLLTASYLVSIIVSVAISFLVMLAVRAAWRRLRRRRMRGSRQRGQYAAAAGSRAAPRRR